MKFAIVFFFISLSALAKPIPVLVGGYEFPPYIMRKNGHVQGLTLDFIELLNQKQTKYAFTFVLTSPTRRYSDMKDGRFQIIPFESSTWGWSRELIESSKIFHEGGEVFITLKEKGKDQSYFKSLEGKTIKGIQGYHYEFVGLSTAPKALKNFNIELTSTHDGNILSVLNKRAELAIVSKEYLDLYLQENPDVKERLLVSKDFDQIYRLGVLVKQKGSPISVAEVNRIIDSVVKDGSWNSLLKKKGISQRLP
ncbi:transporter substrate-binding domain-containing protein [Bdellovibrio sp. 22V]|uniref:substrate-binding periplasmic protein n=1 Tax=Bdellovibrio TaxID=958 RepID=UPI0025438A44|nr:transporter substrate-binding domain-containing protein [Bdellovibrio sp. 22V]WII72070.1 transporter substrate-binding domain-containing protein [Bdellovibrio sp. 22V]